MERNQIPYYQIPYTISNPYDITNTYKNYFPSISDTT